MSISIHAPPRGATPESGKHCQLERDFNSRPSARGDCARTRRHTEITHFNSRPSARGDPKFGRCYDERILFQFTPLREGRLYVWTSLATPVEFQFTPLREGRLSKARLATAWHPYFNSRPSARGDAGGSAGGWRFCYFNSRPSARGDSKRYAISANLLFNPYKSAWLNNRARQFVEIILVIFHRIIA